MPSAEPESNELFDVVILRFDTRSESAAERLQRVFGLPLMAAETLLTELPATVRRGVNRVRAEYFRRALTAIGAQVEVHDAAGRAVAAEASAPKPPARKAEPEILQPRAAADASPLAPKAEPEVLQPRAAADASPLVRKPAENSPQASAPSSPLARKPAENSPQASAPSSPLVHQPAQSAPPPISFAPARNAGASTLMRGSASPRPFAPPRFDSPTAGPREFASGSSWAGREAANDLEALLLPGASNAAADPAGSHSETAYADTPESSPAGAGAAPPDPARAADLAWGELDRGPAPAPRPRARRRQQPSSLPPPAGQIERIGPGPLSEAPLQLQSLPVSPRPAQGESSRPSARRGSKPHSAPQHDPSVPLRGASAPPMLGRWELAGSDPRAARAEAPSGAPLAVQSLASPARRPAAGSPEGLARAVAARSIKPVEPRSFWECLPEALLFPWLGRGLFYLISISIWAVAANLLSALAGIVPFAGVSVAFFANTSVLAMCADYHRRCMWAIAHDEAELDEGPDFDPSRILHAYMRSGAHLVIFMAVSQLPVVLWVVSAIFAGGLSEGLDSVGSPVFWLLAFGPACYWPAAVACASLYNRYSGVWFVPVGVRLIVRAPLEYLAILFVGGSAFLLPWLFGVMIGKAAGLPSAFFAAASGFPLALSHAVMGALTGQLMRTRPDVFE